MISLHEYWFHKIFFELCSYVVYSSNALMMGSCSGVAMVECSRGRRKGGGVLVLVQCRTGVTQLRICLEYTARNLKLICTCRIDPQRTVMLMLLDQEAMVSNPSACGCGAGLGPAADRRHCRAPCRAPGSIEAGANKAGPGPKPRLEEC